MEERNEEQARSKDRSERRWSAPRIVLFCLLLAVFCASGGVLLREVIREHREASAFEKLLTQLGDEWEDGSLEPSGGQTSQPQTPDREEQPEADADAGTDGGAFHRYDKLYEMNPDLFGWVSIGGTVINYPVMYTPEDPEYYLHRSFTGEDSKSGVPFLDGKCYEGCGNYLIYGHDMKNGSMFAGLLKYAKKSYWEEHPIVSFDTVSEQGEYEVLAAFYERVHYTTETDVFRYYHYTDVTDPEVFDEYIEQVRKAAIYDTGVDAVYGDQLISLSTCAYHTSNGRFVVVARRVRDGEGTM